MSERIDHATEASRLMSTITTYDWAEESPYVDLSMAAAEVHTLLAIHEQLRIANVIALSQVTDGNGWQASEPLNALFAYRSQDPEDGFEGLHIRPDIADSLSINITRED